jgi:hypothetical protein
MNATTMKQINERMGDVDWDAVMPRELDQLVEVMADATKAEHAYDVKSEVWSTWCLAGLLVSLVGLFSDGPGTTSACLAIMVAWVYAAVRAHQARRCLQEKRDITYRVVDILAVARPNDVEA